MGIVGIFHTGLTVSNLDRSVAFYRDVLGLELLTQWDSSQPYLRRIVGYPDAELRIALLRIPGPGGRGGSPSFSSPVAGGSQEGATGHHIELLEYRTPRGTRGDPNTYQPGNVHVSFVVDDLDTVYAGLKAKGVRFKSEPVLIDHGRNTGAKAVYAFDPDDITLEFVQPAGRS
jgi:catechol 2,3-dioxygenase-like lactoylglutathione lyase family enzyme